MRQKNDGLLEDLRKRDLPILEELKRRGGLVCLHSTMSGPGIQTHRIWAIDIDANYPWAGGWTDRREDASAFTPAFMQAINERLDAWKQGRYFEESAPTDHDGAICYLAHEINQR